MITINDIGKRVIATTDQDAIYAGILIAVGMWDAQIECDRVDIGHGWELENATRRFRLDQVELANHWIEIVAGHRVFKPGDRFLVIEKRGDSVLAWRDGEKPAGGSPGTLIHEDYYKIAGEAQ